MKIALILLISVLSAIKTEKIKRQFHQNGWNNQKVLNYGGKRDVSEVEREKRQFIQNGWNNQKVLNYGGKRQVSEVEREKRQFIQNGWNNEKVLNFGGKRDVSEVEREKRQFIQTGWTVKDNYGPQLGGSFHQSNWNIQQNHSISELVEAKPNTLKTKSKQIVFARSKQLGKRYYQPNWNVGTVINFKRNLAQNQTQMKKRDLFSQIVSGDTVINW